MRTRITDLVPCGHRAASLTLFVAALLLSTTSAAAVHCPPPPCQIGPCYYLELTADGDFSSEECTNWHWEGASREVNDACASPWPGPAQTWVAELDTVGGYSLRDSLWQEITLPDGEHPFDPTTDSLDLQVRWRVAGDAPSWWDNLRVRVYAVDPATGQLQLAESPGGLRGNTAPTSCTTASWSLQASDYLPGQTLRLVFESQLFTTGTAFYLDGVHVWWIPG